MARVLAAAGTFPGQLAVPRRGLKQNDLGAPAPKDPDQDA